MSHFKDSKATSNFLLLMNDTFDILKSKSKSGMNEKKPITKEIICDIECFLSNASHTLGSLKDGNKVPIVKGPRKMFVIGFCISALSLVNSSNLVSMFSHTHCHMIRLTSTSQNSEADLAGIMIPQHCK